MPSLSAIDVYPLKSTAGSSLAESPVTALGLPFDRRWALFGEDGNVVTARDVPALLTLKAQPEGEELIVSRSSERILSLPLEAGADGAAVPVLLWGEKTEGREPDPAASAWFSDFTGRPVRLLEMPDREARGIPGYVGAAKEDRVRFADECPLLLISEASLADLNARLEAPIGMERFRPNLVVRGCAAFAEDGWRKVRIGDVVFQVLQPCERCQLTTIDPVSLERDPRQEPLRTLGKYRKIEDGGVAFGVHLVARGEGVIRLGDAVEGLA